VKQIDRKKKTEKERQKKRIRISWTEKGTRNGMERKRETECNGETK